jgi:VCBS repeat protein
MLTRTALFPVLMMCTCVDGQTCDPMMLFAPEVRTQMGSTPEDIAAADFDGDGDLDLVIAGVTLGPRFFQVMLNNGDGSFAAPVEHTLMSNPFCVTVADMNNDTHMDVILGHGSNPDVSIALGDGMGGFSTAVEHSAGGFATINDLVTGDWDGDGFNDVAVVTNGNQIRTLQGDGAGGLGPQSTTLTFGVSVALAVADLNADGDPDLVLGDQNGEVKVMYGIAGDDFAVQTGVDVGVFVQHLDLADMDNDGDLDVVVSGILPSEIVVVENTGGGVMTLGPSQSIAIVPQGVATADFDADGNNDVIVALSNTNAVALMRGNGDLTLNPQINYGAGTDNLRVVAEDLDGNGSADVACASGNGLSVSVLLNTCAAGCPADLTGEGDLNFLDVSAFLAAYGNMDPIADFEADGMFNFLDVSAFLAAFAAGCP